MNKLNKGLTSMEFIFIVVLLLITSFGTYYFATHYSFAKKIVPTPNIAVLPTFVPTITQSPIDITNANTDEHGCVLSNGYSWCQSQTRCVKPREEYCSDFIQKTVAIVDEKTVIKSYVMDDLIVKHGNSAKELNITVNSVNGDYAKGEASGTGGGGIWFAAKVDSVWKLVWDGNGSIQCSDIAPYPEFPISMIPECYNEVTQKVVVR
jgi:hypothetical protein